MFVVQIQQVQSISILNENDWIIQVLFFQVVIFAGSIFTGLIFTGSILHVLFLHSQDINVETQFE